MAGILFALLFGATLILIRVKMAPTLTNVTVPHQPTRQRERAMKRFESVRHAQRFLSAFSGISAHFRPRRHRLSATQWRTEIDERFAVWREVTALDAAA